MQSFGDALGRVALALWAGGTWTVGYIVAPLLFATLDDRMLAGTLAGRGFSAIAWVGIGCGLVLLATETHRLRRWSPSALMVVAAALLGAIGEFALHPKIAALRSSGFGDLAQFRLLHGLSSVMYLLQSLLLLWLVARPRSGSDLPASWRGK